MTDPNYTHILVIGDDSGSMAGSPAYEMNKALVTYFTEQAEVEGTALVDFVKFGTSVRTVYEDSPVETAAVVLSGHSGMTALLDAIGIGATNLGRKLAKLPEARRPGKVQVVIVTDGMENQSRQYTSERVKALIKEQTDTYKWDFVFLGANIDAVEVGATFGINPDKALTFDINNAVAMASTSHSLSAYTTTYRGAGGAAAAFSDEDRENAVGATSETTEKKKRVLP